MKNWEKVESDAEWLGWKPFDEMEDGSPWTDKRGGVEYIQCRRDWKRSDSEALVEWNEVLDILKGVIGRTSGLKREVLEMLMDGMTNKDIAARLGMSEREAGMLVKLFTVCFGTRKERWLLKDACGR